MANMAVQQEEAAAREKKSNKKVMGGLLMFGLILAHSVMRWVVLVGAVAALVGARLAGDRGQEGWGGRTGFLYTLALDVQVLIGLVIWTLETGWRLNAFFAFIHPVTMVLAMLVAHFGRRRQVRSVPAAGFWAYAASLGLVLAAIPWRA